jgi:eukaryotic-like serine/threonine-protein kinase
VNSGGAAGAARQPAAAAERSWGLVGSVIEARYRVNAVSSASRDVVVYTAEDVRHGRSVVLKVLRDEFARDAPFVAAVRDQASAMAMHAHVLRGVQRVYQFGATATGQFFVALEWAEGAAIRDVVDAGGALAPSTALRVAIRVGEALEALHRNRILHGQLGPDSVLMDTDGERVCLVGVELTAAYRTPLGRRLGDAFPLAYRAPEQTERGETTEATDVYALGMLLRELLTAGERDKTTGAPTAAPLPMSVERIITTALDVRPEHRYPDISVMLNDIWGATTVLGEPAPRARSVKPRGNPRRRVRRRRPRFTLGIAAAVVTAGIIPAVIWVAGFERIVSRLYDRLTVPALTAEPVDRGVTPPSVSPFPIEPSGPPSSASATGEETSTRGESRPVKEAVTVEGLVPAVAKPLPAPVVVQQRPVAAPAVGSRPRAGVESGAPAEPRAQAEQPARLDRPDTDVGDGSAIIDWLLKDRR